MLQGTGRAVTFEQVKRKAVWETAIIAAIAALSCNARRLPCKHAPNPGGEIIRQGYRQKHSSGSALNPQHNIIYRDCVTGRWGPNPTACFRSAHNLDYVKRLRQRDARCTALNPPCRVGRQNWVRCAGLRPPGRLLAQDFLRGVRTAAHFQPASILQTSASVHGRKSSLRVCRPPCGEAAGRLRQ